MAQEPAGDGWLEISAVLRADQLGPVEERLLEAGALAVTLQDAADAPVLEPAPGETPLWPRLSVTGLFAADRDPLALLAELHAAAPGIEWHSAALADRAWAREWLRDFKPLRFGRRLAVVPHGQDAPADTVVVRLDPGLAFGTGTHPTTALCLTELDGMSLDGCTVVDYGCGSGILAVAALKLGAARALGVDNDPQALAASRDNCARNHLAASALDIALPGAEAIEPWRKQADLVVANILAGPLMALSGTLLGLLKPGGTLLLSGLLNTQAAELSSHYRDRIELSVVGEREDWVCLRGTLS